MHLCVVGALRRLAPSLRRLAGFEALIDCGLFHSRYVLAAAIVLLQQLDKVPFEGGGGALALAALAAASIAVAVAVAVSSSVSISPPVAAVTWSSTSILPTTPTVAVPPVVLASLLQLD